MNADAFRHFFEYHFSENRKLWDDCISTLTAEQFTQELGYSHGSVRQQVVHLMDVDDLWFSELQGGSPLQPLPPAMVDDRESLRARWDDIERRMRQYLAGLQDEQLSTRPITDPEEDKELVVWQVLLHVVNHGTDHRAQILHFLHQLGVKTAAQDYIFFVYDHP